MESNFPSVRYLAHSTARVALHSAPAALTWLLAHFPLPTPPQHILKLSFWRRLISLTSFLGVPQCKRGEIPSGQECAFRWLVPASAPVREMPRTKEREGSRCASFGVSSPACIAPLAERIAFFREVAGSVKKVEH